MARWTEPPGHSARVSCSAVCSAVCSAAARRFAVRSALARRSVASPVTCPLLAVAARAAVWVAGLRARETSFWRAVLLARETSEWRGLVQAICLWALVRAVQATSEKSAAWCTISRLRLAVAGEVAAWVQAMSEWSAAWRVVLLLAEAREVAARVASDPRRWLRISRTPWAWALFLLLRLRLPQAAAVAAHPFRASLCRTRTAPSMRPSIRRAFAGTLPR